MLKLMSSTSLHQTCVTQRVLDAFCVICLDNKGQFCSGNGMTFLMQL